MTDFALEDQECGTIFTNLQLAYEHQEDMVRRTGFLCAFRIQRAQPSDDRTHRFEATRVEAPPGIRAGVWYNPTHSEPDGDRQPREHAVLCSGCMSRWTFNVSGRCGLCGA